MKEQIKNNSKVRITWVDLRANTFVTSDTQIVCTLTTRFSIGEFTTTKQYFATDLGLSEITPVENMMDTATSTVIDKIIEDAINDIVW